MRRKERKITDMDAILETVSRCKVIRIAINAPGAPYIIPLNFGYRLQDGRLEFCFHCAGEGKKLELLRQNAQIGFEMDGEHRLITGETACSYGFEYESITGTGEVCQVAEEEEKKELLQRLMYHQTGKQFSFTAAQLHFVTVCKIKVISLSGKRNLR